MAEAVPLRQRAAPVLGALTPHPHRGDLIAAGAVPLTLGVALVNARLDAEWGTGIFLVLSGLACALVLGMGLLARSEGGRPRAYHEALLLAGLALLLIALLRLAQVLGVEDPLSAAGTTTWVFGALALLAGWLARTRRSAICAFVAALTGIVAVLSFVRWAFDPDSATTWRWVLLAIAIGLVLAALSQRERRRRESVYLVDAAGIAVLLLALSFLADLISPLTFVGAPPGGPGGGWELVMLAAGLGLLAYSGVDREPGPGYLGVLVLLLFVLYAGIPGAEGASLWFWPLALLLAGGAMVAAGLRPRRPLPPEPGAERAPGEPLPGPGAPERSSSSLWSERTRDDAPPS